MGRELFLDFFTEHEVPVEYNGWASPSKTVK